MVETEGFVKGGEQQVRYTVRRSKGGILINIQTHPDFERAIREDWSTGDPIDVREFGPDWIPQKSPMGDKPKLRIYPLANDPGPITYGPGLVYSLSQPGRGYLVGDARALGVGGVPPGTQIINLGLLLLVGTSEQAGVTFELRGAFSYPSLKDTLHKLTEASKRFYIDYLMDIELTVKIITQETRL
jgi:hypothetical protein